MNENIWLSGKKVELPEMLAGREARVETQRRLLAAYPSGCLISFTLNIAGPVKVYPLAEFAFDEGIKQLEGAFSGGFSYREIQKNNYGLEAFFTTEMPAG